MTDNDTRDFDEHYLPRVPMEVDEPDGSCMDVYLRLATCKGGVEPKREAELIFVNNGFHLSLCAVPWESLKILARFINDTVQDFEARADV